jgi:suppressor of fused-like protein
MPVRLFGAKRSKEPQPDPPTEAPGWMSIEQAFAGVYGEHSPDHRAPPIPPPLEGGILNGISAYRGDDHWHLTTFGLTELFAKASDDPDHSGWGYELTLIAPPTPDAPDWAFRLLLAIAQTTVQDDAFYDVGHRLDAGKPIDGASSRLTAVAFCVDRVVTPKAFPFGRYTLLQMVGITAEELAEMKQSSTDIVLDRLAQTDSLLMTNPDRA